MDNTAITKRNQLHPLNLFSSEVSVEMVEPLEQNRELTQAFYESLGF